MFENIANFFKKLMKNDKKAPKSKDSAKERLHLVLMQDRANVSADFLDLMKQEIIEVIKKYIDIDENAIDVRLTNKTNEDGTNGAPALYANIPIVSIKDEAKKKPDPEKEEDVNKTEEEKANNNEKNEENKQQENIEEPVKVEENKQDEPKEEENNKEQNTEEQEEVKQEEVNENLEEKEEEKTEVEEQEKTKEKQDAV